jgi:integrase
LISDWVKTYDSTKRWLTDLSQSPATIRGALYSLHRFCRWADTDPDRLINQRYEELKSADQRVKFRAEDKVREFSRAVQGGYVFAAYMKSFYRANHAPLELNLDRPLPSRETEKIPQSKEEIRALFAKTTDETRALLAFLIESGARIGSVLKLRYRSIKEDFEAGRVPCKVAFPAKITKGGIQYVAFIGPDTVSCLRELFELRRQKGETISDDTLLFVSRNGRPLSVGTTIMRIERAGFNAGLLDHKCQGCGVELASFDQYLDHIKMHRADGKIKGLVLKPFTPHKLRKRAQTILESSGIPVNWVDLLLGHVPRGAQGAVYSRPQEDELRRAYEAAIPKLSILGSDGGVQPGPGIQSMHIQGQDQRLIRPEELESYLSQGWAYVAAISPLGKILVQRTSVKSIFR